MTNTNPSLESGPELLLTDFTFDLPDAAIAQHPPERREDARMLRWTRQGPVVPEDSVVADWPDALKGDELIILNDTRVIRARLQGKRDTGGAVEFLALHIDAMHPNEMVAMGRASKKLRPGTRVTLNDGAEVWVETVLGKGRYRISFGSPDAAFEEKDAPFVFLEAHGSLPLPPYMDHSASPTEADLVRYQTVFAREDGSVAAPTAGLHFTSDLLERIRNRGCQVETVTLHVGPGTFVPVRTERLRDHTMHSEHYTVPEATAEAIRVAKAEGRPVLAVGTTVVRTLEASARAHGGLPQAGSADTDLFLMPGATFQVVDQLVTNFHLPGSTLLVLVAAFAGRERTLAAYGEALNRGYRFYSYGDAMWIR